MPGSGGLPVQIEIRKTEGAFLPGSIAGNISGKARERLLPPGCVNPDKADRKSACKGAPQSRQEASGIPGKVYDSHDCYYEDPDDGQGI